MLTNLLLKPFAVFAQSQPDGYIMTQEAYENDPNYARGFEPFESLPATWHNTMLKSLTEQANATYRIVYSIYNELKNVIGTLDDSTNHQLKDVLDVLVAPVAATALALGSIKIGYTETAADSKRAVVLNSSDQAYVDCRLAGSGQAGLAVHNDASWGVTYDAQSSGKGTVKTVTASTAVPGIVQLSDTLTMGSTRAVTAVAVNTLKVSLKVEAGKLYVSLGTVIPSGYSTSVTLPSSAVATYAKYLVNSDSPSGTNYVTADTSRNLKAHTLELT